MKERGAESDPAGSVQERGAEGDPAGTVRERGAEGDPAGSEGAYRGPLKERAE
ncbi:MAG: hypothetical protein KZQ93_20650 [Candidatus Thiodiazotropha sp. (ex Monitilora ramsayi)]|nr:hypothetical protein [Candidatus Thiodiazotropha sp. (ex Monitilora ramsayi)]MCU7846253.1 hypothetical protein [Candidatus Thiodiazotropha sp. (ex Monitilora ramsayi)]